MGIGSSLERVVGFSSWFLNFIPSSHPCFSPAGTYAFASRLSPIVLDTLLALPHVLLSIRNALLLTPPTLPHPSPKPLQPPSSESRKVVPTATSATTSDHEPPSDIDGLSDPGSDADIESNSGYGSGVGESWINLNKRDDSS